MPAGGSAHEGGLVGEPLATIKTCKTPMYSAPGKILPGIDPLEIIRWVHKERNEQRYSRYGYLEKEEG